MWRGSVPRCRWRSPGSWIARRSPRPSCCARSRASTCWSSARPARASPRPCGGSPNVLGGHYFEYLIGRFTEPNELFGPIDLRAPARGRRRGRDRRACSPRPRSPSSTRSFSARPRSSTRCSGMLNERVFRRGRTALPVALRVCVGASNALPDDPALAAFADRFLGRDLRRLRRPTRGWRSCSRSVGRRGRRPRGRRRPLDVRRRARDRRAAPCDLQRRPAGRSARPSGDCAAPGSSSPTAAPCARSG